MKLTWKRGAVLVLWLLTAAMATAAEQKAVAPEALFSQESVLFLRYHGMSKAQEAYDKTAWAEVMRGEFGQFWDHALNVAGKVLQTQLARSNDKEIEPLKAFLPHARPLLH
jgi:hypothetical protein